MSKLVVILRILLLCMSFYGYLQYLQKKICLELSVGVLISGIGSMMFLSGILNLMPEVAWSIFAGGIFLAIYSMNRRDDLRDIFSPGTIFFLIAAAGLLLLLHGSKVLYYDNFTHWAFSTRIIISHDRFPDASDRNFLFRSYPLGSAAFIFYIAEIAGLTSEWFQMYIQTMMSVGMLVGLFAFGKKGTPILLVLVGSIMLLCGNIPFTDLLVDTLLPLVGLSGIAFCIYYKNELKERILQLIPYTVFLISIKNSGIFFAAALLGFAWYCARHEKIGMKVWATTVLAPTFTLLLWNKHVDQVFLHAQPSKHSVSISNYAGVFQNKSFDDIRTIVSKMGHNTVSLSNPGVQILLVGLVIFLIWKFAFRLPVGEMKEILVFAAVTYAVYQIGLLCMYLFSMPNGEALSLAEYSRYHATIMIYLSGLILLEILQAGLQPSTHSWQRPILAAVFCFVLLSIFCTLKPNFSYFEKQRPEETERGKFDALIENYGIVSEANYAVLVSSERSDDGYLYYLGRYLLDPEFVTVIPDNTLEEFDGQEYNYIIAFEETVAIRDYLSQQFHEDHESVIYLG